MIAQDLLAELEQIGVKLTVAEDKLHLEAPAGALTDDLRQALRQHKAELLALLREREQADLDADAREIAEVFHQRGWVAFSSRLLNGETVVFVKDANIAIPTRWEGAVAYTLAELEALAKLPVPGPEALKQLHEAKKMFEGTVEAMPDGR